MNKWYGNRAEEPIVIASRVQLKRNLAQYRFVGKMEGEEYSVVADLVRGKAADLERVEDMKYYSCSVGKLSPLEREALVENSIISAVLPKKQGAALVLSEDEGVSILVNEEDHICIRVNALGSDLKKAYGRALRIDGCLEELGYAYDPRYGYLCASPLHTGTGFHADYLLFLPAITMTGKLQKLSDEIGKFDMEIFGISGEGTKTEAFLYRVVNRKTLGLTEEEIMAHINQVLEQIVAKEKKYREYLCQGSETEILDKVFRSFGILRYAKKLNTADSLMLYSQLKFGHDLGLITLLRKPDLYGQLMKVQPANLQKLCGKSLSVEERGKYRADYFNRLMECERGVR
ncbi:MAG: hypothetical protein K2N63_03685 [Lachnospiraceae bacterium]|nr:hypothetical protein [Lachnospiraceae bacterium]